MLIELTENDLALIDVALAGHAREKNIKDFFEDRKSASQVHAEELRKRLQVQAYFERKS